MREHLAADDTGGKRATRGRLQISSRALRFSAVAVWSALLVTGLVILWRRSIGACPITLPAPVACISAGIATLLSLMAHGLYRSAASKEAQSAVNLPASLVTIASGLLLTLAVLPSDLVSDGLGVLVILFLAGLAAALYADLPWVRAAFGNGVRVGFGAASIPRRAFGTVDANDASQPAGRFQDRGKEPEFTPELVVSDQEGEIRQWLTRRLSETGQDCMEGAVKVHLEFGEKQATVHVPFCPPFETVPEVSCHVIDDSGARSKVAAVFPYGVRIEVKRSAAAKSPQLVEMAFTATAPASTPDAA